MRAVVVGAGFAGLAAADALARSGLEVVVLEARDRVGGRVWSEELPGGAVIERGAEFILPGNTVVREMADRLGLALYDKGTTYGEREPRGGIGVTQDELRDALRAVEAAVADGALLDGDLVDALDALDIHPGAREVILARIEVSTAHPGADQDARVLAEAGTGFGRFPTHSVGGGNQRIALALAERLGPAVHLRTPVNRVAWSATGAVVAAGGAEVAAEFVVLAVPAAVLGDVEFEPPLPPARSAALRNVRYGHAAKLFVPLATPAPPSATLSVPDRFWTFTQLAPDGSPLPVAAAFAGTTEALERLRVADGPGDWVAAVRRLRPDLDLDEGPVVLSTWSDDPWARAAYSARTRSSPDDALLAAPIGPLHFAGEHTAGPWHALMEGALRSGLRAAAEIAQAAASGAVRTAG